jgi:hypothetical protein
LEEERWAQELSAAEADRVKEEAERRLRMEAVMAAENEALVEQQRQRDLQIAEEQNRLLALQRQVQQVQQSGFFEENLFDEPPLFGEAEAPVDEAQRGDEEGLFAAPRSKTTTTHYYEEEAGSQFAGGGGEKFNELTSSLFAANSATTLYENEDEADAGAYFGAVAGAGGKGNDNFWGANEFDNGAGGGDGSDGNAVAEEGNVDANLNVNLNSGPPVEEELRMPTRIGSKNKFDSSRNNSNSNNGSKAHHSRSHPSRGKAAG